MPRSLHYSISGAAAALTSSASLCIICVTAVVAGAATPGYSHLSQFISELGARGSPTEWGMRNAGFLPAGLLLLAFSWLAFRALPRSRGSALGMSGLAIYAAGYLVACAFPCDLGCRPKQPSTSQLLHNLGGLVGYLLAPAFLFSLARAARAWPGAGHLAVAGYVAAGSALVGLLTLSPNSPFAGLSQRVLEAAVLGWAAMCGVYILRRSASVA